MILIRDLPWFPVFPFHLLYPSHPITNQSNIIIFIEINFYKVPSNQTIIWWKLIRIILTVTPFGPGAPGIPASPWRPCEINKTNTCINKILTSTKASLFLTRAYWGSLGSAETPKDKKIASVSDKNYPKKPLNVDLWPSVHKLPIYNEQLCLCCDMIKH